MGLTLTEKILNAHIVDGVPEKWARRSALRSTRR